MSATDTVRSFINALEANETATATNVLTDNFMFSGWTPQPMNKQQFLGMISELKEGIPGLMFNLHNLDEQDDIEQGAKVTGNMQIAGYQSDSFSIPTLSLPPIPQMGKSISLPVEDVTFIVQSEQVARMTVKRTPGGGMEGLLHQLGTDSPIIQ